MPPVTGTGNSSSNETPSARCKSFACWLMLYAHTFLIYCVTGCRAFSVFSAEVFERAMSVLKVINSTGNAA